MLGLVAGGLPGVPFEHQLCIYETGAVGNTGGLPASRILLPRSRKSLGERQEGHRCVLVRFVAYMLCFRKRENARLSSKVPVRRLVHDGAVFRIEFYIAPGGAAPAEACKKDCEGRGKHES
jgi:hypothetical protein